MNSPIDCLPQPTPEPAPLQPAQLPLPVHYDHNAQSYWIDDEEGKWIKVTEGSVKNYLGTLGHKDGGAAILKIQRGQNVNYAGKLAGYDAGPHNQNGTKILVTESPKIIIPVAGACPLLEAIFEGMLNVEATDQRPYFFGWLKRSYESLRSRKRTPAQVVAFAGPPNSAKSLVQQIVTEILGGRGAKPFQFMTNKTNFNADLFEAEHLIVEDESESINYKDRREFASHIKRVSVNAWQHCHGKYKNALMLKPFWRMTISLNNDPERLLVLPPITDDLADKIMLFKVAQKPMPRPTETAEERDEFWQALVAELPAFLDFLVNSEIPEAIRSARFGVVHYHHPDLLMALNETAPEMILLSLIDKYIFDGLDFGSRQWIDVTALDVSSFLRSGDGKVRREADSLLGFPAACGTYLGRLIKSHPDRVTRRLLKGRSLYTLLPPVSEPTPSSAIEKGCGVEAFSNNSSRLPERGGGVEAFSTSFRKRNKTESLMEKQRSRVKGENWPHPSTPTATSNQAVAVLSNLPHPSTPTGNQAQEPAVVITVRPDVVQES